MLEVLSSDGGSRESKILEYFLSLQLLPISPSDIVIDVASERSVFPDDGRCDDWRSGLSHGPHISDPASMAIE